MGIGYNPSLVNQGERLDMLGFFNWFRTLQEKDIDVTIWDASSYAIVNCRNYSGTAEFAKLGNKPTAKDILSWAIQEQERGLDTYESRKKWTTDLDPYKKLDQFRENCDLRNRYLKAFAIATNTPVNVVSAWDTFRKDQNRFANCLEEALEFIRKKEIDNPDFYNAFISGDDPIKKLYVPLEIAEALYFQNNQEIEVKFGPITEKEFDAAIIDCQNWLGNDYTTIRCPLLPGQNKPAYLRDLSLVGKDIATGMKRKQIARVYRKNVSVSRLYQGILEPTGIEQDLLYTTVGIVNKIEDIVRGL